jgi:DNA-binding NarL/FixJ family response regulator
MASSRLRFVAARATGQTKPRAGDNVLDRLTPQEFEIVSLAASGLTNK